MIAAVGLSISGIPGPPFGPSYRMTTTSPFFTSPILMPLLASCSQSNTRALPTKVKPSFPVIFATHPSSARFPLNILICPLALIGLEISLTTSCLGSKAGNSAKFSASVFPVTVIQSPCRNPCLSRYLSTAGVPPALDKSSMRY